MEYRSLPKDLDDYPFEFTLAEIVEMDNILKDTGDQTLGQEFFQDVALHFSCSPWRAGKSSVTAEQVKGWFENRQNELRSSSKKAPPPPPPPSPPPPPPPKLLLYHSDSSFLTDAPSSEPPDSLPELKGKASDLSELAFEAFSSRDNAWYDVASFLSYRVNCHGELDARVRYAGFGKDEDEWVNVARGVRERSIPLESSECYRVKVGDLVLCYREGQDHALYFDAYVVEIQRRLHDIGGCRCIFVVRYDHDNHEEKVHLGRLCCRPAAYNNSDPLERS
ncbi:protein SAWADEE HOMEODOMAIN HOMOLOG 1-like [Momordica charantia]|uniref:Protein SAWADEE HOMEODOMAIN HOMOLOG 1-like n=1 Tax=Momordica charantia TaxID=3673 RepID=A0A6J1DBC4_MOMCH|nr:protein SAWADEE HOMEODOMAIN HOMOLOG 1-like [Momordica charantia]